MRKCIWVSVILLVIQIGYKIIPAFAQGIEATFVNPTQEDQDTSAIKKVIETFLNSYVQRDIDGLMNVISKNYSATQPTQVVDYDQFKVLAEKRLKSAIDMSISNLKIVKLGITGNNASVVAVFNFKGLVLRNTENIDSIWKRQYSLVKEDGLWKIVSIKMLRPD